MPKPPEPPYTIYSLTLFKLRRHDKTRTYWITFRDPVNPKQIQKQLNKAYRKSCSVYSGLITSKPEMHTCIVELPEEYEWGYIVSVTERVLSYLL